MQRVFGKKLFHLPLIVIFLAGCSGLSFRAESKIPKPLERRIRELYSILSVVRVNNVGARNHIRQFFMDENDLDRFVVLTTQRLIRANVYDMKIREVAVERVDIDGNVATVRLKYWGNKRFPLFKGKVEEVQKWINADGKWYLKPIGYLK